jgi:hypothetical protein
MVRPRIAPAFAQPAEGSECAPAGEALRQGPERLPAMAPLPIEPARAMQRVKPAEQTVEPQWQKLRNPQPRLPEPENTSSAKKYMEAEETEIEAVRPRTQREIVETESAVKPATKLEPRELKAVQSAKVNSLEILAAPVFQAARGKNERRDESHSADLTADTTSAVPLTVPALRPANRHLEPRFETSRKRETSEPAIQVTIGKIEVRASIAAPKTTEKKTPTGAMSLEEYQRLRNRRSAG